MVRDIEAIFSKLRATDYRITSPSDDHYNCIAWAAGDAIRWWWPGRAHEEDYWPAGVTESETLPAFMAVFASLGYVPCEDENYEFGFEKIAIFAAQQGTPTHAARQLPDGRWTSKLGLFEDIEHNLHDLEGSAYGSVVQIMRRPTAAVAPPSTA